MAGAFFYSRGQQAQRTQPRLPSLHKREEMGIDSYRACVWEKWMKERRRWGFLAGIGLEVLAICLLLYSYRSGSADAVSQNAGSRTETEGERESETEQETEEDFIRWVDFGVTCKAMKQAYAYDTQTYGQEIHLDWLDLLAYLGAKYGGDFSRYQKKDLEQAAQSVLGGEAAWEELTGKLSYYEYYREAYGAVLGGLVGAYEEEEQDESGKVSWVKKYGLKGFSPIAKGFPYSDYDDFGVARSYGYRRNHLGHDMMGQVGTPIVAVESGVVAVMGWNQYGGWRIGINSFDGKRYYYYAHLRQNFPYCKTLKEGDVVQAGDVIGYMGRTGYSAKENVNNIDESHLHFGLQLIFDESQREGVNEIWVSGYELVKFLHQNQSQVVRDDATKEWSRVYQIRDPAAEAFKKEKK